MRIKFTTYNIHRAIGVDRRFRLDRIAEVLKHHNADVVLLQEVDEGAPRSQHLDLARELAELSGYPHWKAGYNVTLRKGRYGNATLSRFPIVRESNIDLTIPNQNLQGSWIRRGCQHTTLALPDDDRHLEVFNLHLGLSARERQRQVGLLVNSPEFRDLGPRVPVVVGGDFNDWRSLLQPIFLDVFGFGCATQTKGGLSVTPTYPSFSPQGGLDRLYFRGPLRLDAAHRCRLKVSRVASDHLPVIAEFSLLGGK